LTVENYAVVEKVRVRFHRGLNLLTGETGSGKSIVVDALALLLGGRASAEMVRSGAERARVSGIFELAREKGLQALLSEAGIETEDGELIVEREILANGKSRAFAGNRPVTAALLRDLAGYLGDIHGQHDQQQLFSFNVQREMLDGFAGAAELAAETAALYARWRAASEELAELDRTAQEGLWQALNKKATENVYAIPTFFGVAQDLEVIQCGRLGFPKRRGELEHFAGERAVEIRGAIRGAVGWGAIHLGVENNPTFGRPKNGEQLLVLDDGIASERVLSTIIARV
jgi:energy-coupling factor transporter ATP-binding protein EcfA2